MAENFTVLQTEVVEFDPFAGPEMVHIAPSTEPQIEVWTACLLGGDNATRAYNIVLSLRLIGAFDRPAMEQAIQALLRRHEVLRSVFSANGEHLCVFKEVVIDIAYQDISEKPADQKDSLIEQYAKQDALHIFNLLHGPLFKAGLFTVSDQEHRLVLTTHHSISDGWSTGVILQDLSALYSAYTQNIYLDLPEAPSFVHYAEEQRKFYESDEYTQIEKYWVDKYKGKVPSFDLPTDFPRPTFRTFKSSRLDFPLDDDLVAAVKKMGLKAGCSFVTTLLAAFDVLLHRLSGQEDIVVGLPTAGQSITGNHKLVGHCVNLLPLRSHLETHLKFSDFLKVCRQSLFDAQDHQRLTFSALLKNINIPRDTSRMPLVPVIFNIDMGMDEGVHFHNLTHQFITHPKEYENFEWFFNISEFNKSLTVEWAYNSDLFKAETIHRLMADFETILKTVVADPSVLVSDITFKSEEGLSEKLTYWNDTSADYPKQPLHELIAQTAGKNPQKTAILFKKQALSYQAVNETANQLAHYLIQQEIKVGDVVGIALDRSPDMLITILAVLKAGAAYLPLDPEYPQDRLAFMLTDSSAKLLITSKKYTGNLASQATEILIENALDAAKACAKNNPDRLVSGHDLAYVLYTSGSTGKPKGVLIEHRNVVNFLWSMQAVPGIKKEDILLAVTTISFDIAGLELYLPLLAGATILLADTATARDGRALLDLVRAQNVSIMQATPSTWRMMLDSGWDKPLPLKALCGGEALPNDLADKLIRNCSELWNVYGPTETTIWSTVKKIDSTQLITIGKPINNTQVYVLDEFLKPVAEGVVGELYIAGDGVARGYLNRPELTAERFVTNPFDKGQTSVMYRTGDLGKFLSTGEIQCLGRVDQQVKVRGHRIEPGEIENVLTGIETIKEAVVIAREDRPGDQQLVAYIVPNLVSAKSDRADWKERWDVMYELGVSYESTIALTDQNLDAAISEQLSGKKEIRQEVDDWLAQSVRRIKALKPKRVIEVGCGAGQLLFEIAPNTMSYVATDYSENAVEKLQEKLALNKAKWRNVKAAVATADDFSTVKESSLDLVLIHSVAQYFPDTTYLLHVIKEAVKHVEPGGCIFIGDMQGKNSLKMHHTFDQFQRSTENNTLADFRKIVDRRVQIEDELLADPAFFYLLTHYIPAISAVDIQLREGRYLNETTKFHYDIWLYVGNPPEVVNADVVVNWTPDYTLERIEQSLIESPGVVLQLTNLFNNRTAPDYQLIQVINALSDDKFLAEAKQKMAAVSPGVDPSRLWSMGETHNFSTHIRWANDGTDNLLDVVFIPRTATKKIPVRPARVASENASLSNFIRNPFTPDLVVSPQQLEAWKQHTQSKLPVYMVPNDFVILARLPLTPNGKIDRKALPEPQLTKTDKQTGYVSPRTDIEKLVSDIWMECLRLEKISVFDNFFELGGHSLIAVQVMTRLEKKTGKRLPLSTLFEYPTVEKLASVLQMDGWSISFDALVPIKPQGTKMPIYIIHGAGLHVMLFNVLAIHMDPDQPIYGLQAKGINSADEPFDNIEEMAAYYIDAIIKNNPDGPYALAGYSFGGLIAYEVSKQLIEKGKEVKLLAMFDTYADQSHYHSAWPVRFWRSATTLLKERLYIFTLLKDNPRETIVFKGKTVKRRVDQLYRRLRYTEQNPAELDDNYYKVSKTNRIAARNYRLVPMPMRVDLFRAKVRSHYMDDFEFLGWRPFALKGVDVHEIPGDHFNLFTSPNDKEFARVLQNVLNNC